MVVEDREGLAQRGSHLFIYPESVKGVKRVGIFLSPDFIEKCTDGWCHSPKSRKGDRQKGTIPFRLA
jgi:hypothetical protein